MRIFVINMKTSVKRRKIMEEQLKNLGLDFEIFEAVRGDSLSEEEIMSYYDKEFYASRPGYFTAGMAGCTISHFLLYKKIVEEKIETCLILEDDMQVGKDLPVLIDRLAEEIKRDEVIMLFYQSYLPIKLSKSPTIALNHKFNLYQVTETIGLRSTGGYIIHYEAAKSMLEKLVPFRAFPDDWKSFFDRKILNGVRVVYPFLMENTYEPTTISPNIKGGMFVRKLLPFLEQKKIFPLYQLLKWRRKIKIAQTRQCVICNEQPVDLRKN